jgi:hypothetical protein
MAQDLSHLQCTDVRRFRNSPTESHARFLHSFQTGLAPLYFPVDVAYAPGNPNINHD